MNLKSIYTVVIISTVFLFGCAYLGSYLAQKQLPTIVWFLIPLYAGLTIFLYKYIAGSAAHNPTRFVTSVYASVLIKLFLSIVIVGVYFFLQYPGRKAFTIAIMGIYTVFTTALIRSLLQILRGNKSQTTQ